MKGEASLALILCLRHRLVATRRLTSAVFFIFGFFLFDECSLSVDQP